MGAVSNEKETGGHWHLEENNLHINVLEMKAVMLGLQVLCKDANNVHICLQSDNTTTVSYITSMGGVKLEICNTMALQIWEWCITRQIWISARHIPVSQNVQTDKASREFKDSVEWSLSEEIFQDINNRWGPFDIDMFASRLNYKVDAYASWRPDPGAKFTDSFCFNRESHFFYAFPPFSLICQCLMLAHNGQKVEQSNIKIEVEIVRIEVELMLNRSRIHTIQSRIHTNRCRIHTNRSRSYTNRSRSLIHKSKSKNKLTYFDLKKLATVNLHKL